jgi:serine/threonine protein kinase
MGRLSSNNECNERLKQIVNATVKKPDELYNMGEVIGEGRFSKVYEGVRAARSRSRASARSAADPHARAPQVGTSGEHAGMKIALKEIDIGTLEEDEEALDMLEAEVLALRRAEGAANVVRLHAVIAASEAIFLAMERVPGRELFELVEERGTPPSPSQLMHMLPHARASCVRYGVQVRSAACWCVS